MRLVYKCPYHTKGSRLISILKCENIPEGHCASLSCFCSMNNYLPEEWAWVCCLCLFEEDFKEKILFKRKVSTTQKKFEDTAWRSNKKQTFLKCIFRNLSFEVKYRNFNLVLSFTVWWRCDKVVISDTYGGWRYFSVFSSFPIHDDDDDDDDDADKGGLWIFWYWLMMVTSSTIW